MRRIVFPLCFCSLLLCGCLGGKLPNLPLPRLRSGNGHLPDERLLPGWKRATEIQRFNKRSLAQYIGSRQARTMRSYGFSLLYACDYSREGDEVPVLTIESYEMEKPLAASGIYHYHRGRKLRMQGVPVDVGVEGALSQRVLYFYKGRYFFKLIYTGEEQKEPDLQSIGQRIAKSIPGQARRPRGFEYLNVAGINIKSARMTQGYTFDYDFLPPSIYAKAPGAGPIATIYLIGHFNEKEAKKTEQDHRYFLKNYGTEYAAKRTARRRWLWEGRDESQGRIIMTRYDTWVIGVLAPKTYKQGELLLERVVKRIGGRY